MNEHNHKSNFGRYVADCPKCVEKYPDGPPARTRKPRPAPAFTAEQLLALQMLADNPKATAAGAITLSKNDLIEALRTLGQDLRKGTPEEEAKRVDEARRL